MSIQKSELDLDVVNRQYFCSVCKAMHSIKLPKNLATNQKNFPFTYIYFHDYEDSILTTLYLDANLQIRGAESIPLSQLETNFEILKNQNLALDLAKELMNVRKLFKDLNEKYNILQEENLELKFDHQILRSKLKKLESK
jgi:hypothetical protein